MTLATILLLAALVCFILAACGVARLNWVPIGLALWVASELTGLSTHILR